MKHRANRREFLKTAATAVAVPYFVSAGALRRRPPCRQ